MDKHKKKSKYEEMDDELLYTEFWGTLYRKFRTGYSFASVSKDLYIEQRRKRENFEYMFVTRHTVLGRWHQIKLEMFELRYHGYDTISRKEMIEYLENKRNIAEEKEIKHDGTSFIF